MRTRVNHHIVGKWRLIEMEQWDREFIDLVEPGFISFQKGGQGEMRFGAVNLELDWEMNEAGKFEFTFTGFDEGDETTGKGFAVSFLNETPGDVESRCYLRDEGEEQEGPPEQCALENITLPQLFDYIEELTQVDLRKA